MPTYTPPTPSITSQLNGTYYGLVYLGLASLAYASENDGSGVASAISQLVQNPSRLPPIPDPTSTTNPPQPLNGYWKLDWGPAVGDNSNVIFIVSFRQGTRPLNNGTDGAPYFFAVVNRGTDTSAWFVALDQQLIQDLGSFSQTAWSTVLGNVPNATSQKIPSGLTGNIANGTRDALIKVTGFTSSWEGNQVNVATAMAALLAQYPGTPTVVTGHSLGGALTQVTAAYLAWQLYGTQTTAVPLVLPNPFAPPTAGDPAFAAMYDTLFPNSNFWFNTTDFVPCAWANLSTVPSLWSSFKWPPANTVNGPSAPWLITEALKKWSGNVPPYARPSNNQQALKGGLPTQTQIQNFLNAINSSAAWNTWDTQLLWQHFPPCYYAQMTSQMSSTVAPYAYVDTKPPYSGLQR